MIVKDKDANNTDFIIYNSHPLKIKNTNSKNKDKDKDKDFYLSSRDRDKGWFEN